MLDNAVGEQRVPIDKSDKLKQSMVDAEERNTKYNDDKRKHIPQSEAVSSSNNNDHGGGSGG
jgi:hypothetical protein